MPAILYSDNQHNVDSLARRIVALTSFTSEQARLVAHALLCRKSLKIKSSALAQLFRSVDKELDTKAMRAEFLAAGLLEKIESTGLDGRPAIYTILAEVEEPVARELKGAEETDETAEDAQKDDAERDDINLEPDEAAVEIESEAAHDKDKMAADAPEGASDSAPEDASEDVSGEPAPAFVSMVGRGSRARQAARSERVGRTYEPKHAARPAVERERGDSEVFAEPEKAEKLRDDASGSVAEPAKPEPAPTPAPVREGEAADPAISDEASVEEPQKAPVVTKDQPSEQPASERKKKRRHRKRTNREEGASAPVQKDEAAAQTDASQGKRAKEHAKAPAENGGKKTPSRKQKPGRASRQDERAKQETNTHPAKVSPLALARVLGGRITRALPHKTPGQSAETRIVKVAEAPSRDSAVHRETRGVSPKQQLNSDYATITAWIEQARGMDVAYASRRQRAFEIFNDEKAFDGKRGERLFKRLNERGVNVAALKITPLRPFRFQSFYGIGADKPFIMVENIDVYEEIARLLRGKKSVKLFGVRVSGVIFGGGCKAAVSHALDDFLEEIGYAYDYVYYAGDIDREGARIVEQARAANNTRVRLHAGIYRAMLIKHRERLKAGRAMESAAENQGIPQNLAQVVKDLPMITRVQFCNVLRDGGRIPQEILSSADYRDSSSNRFDRLLNK